MDLRKEGQRGGQEIEIKFTLDYKASEPIFWHAFKELSNNNNELVSYDKLQERLISTGKFYVGEAVLMIEHMEKIGKVEKTLKSLPTEEALKLFLELFQVLEQ